MINPQRIFLALLAMVFCVTLGAQETPETTETPAPSEADRLSADLFERLEARRIVLFDAMESAYAMRLALKAPPTDLSSYGLADTMSSLDALEEYKRQLIRVYDVVSNEPENSESASSIFALIEQCSALDTSEFREGLNQAQRELLDAHIKRFGWAIDGDNSYYQRLVSPLGFATELIKQDLDKHFVAPDALAIGLREAQLRANPGSSMVVDLGFDFLFAIQLRIDPVEREISRLFEHREELEIARYASLEGGVSENNEAATDDPDIPAHERTQARIDRFTLERELVLNELQLAYLRFARRGQELGMDFSKKVLFSGDLKLNAEQNEQIDQRLREALADLGKYEGRSMLSTEESLAQSLVDWNALRPNSFLTSTLLKARIKARQQRLQTLRETLREARSHFLVRRKAVERQISTLIYFDERLALFEDRWRDEALEFYGIAGIWVLGIFFAAWLLIRMVRLIGRRIVRRYNADLGNIDKDAEARAKTISTAFTGAAAAVIWVIAALMVLGRFGIDYQPLLVATGGVGLAVGFGAQSLVKDFFSGFFILLENQFTVGDVITIDTRTGTVEEINLRTTRLRSLDGTYHTVPNGQITAVANMTHKWSRMVVVIGTGYREDPDQVRTIINRVGAEMFADETWSERLLEPPVVLGLDNLNASSIDFKIVARTKSGEQWAAAREFRRRIKILFDLEDIEIPFQYVNYVQSEAKPSRVLQSPTPSMRKELNEELVEVPDEGAGKREAEKAKEEAANDENPKSGEGSETKQKPDAK